jgi:hypothetical protein
LLLLQSFCLLSRTFSSQSAFEAVQSNIPSFSDLPSQCYNLQTKHMSTHRQAARSLTV